jgi:polyhydroxybutyrate depolymerase
MKKNTITLLLIIFNFSVYAGVFNNHTIKINGDRREYITKLPINENEEMPLIIALHGGGSNWRKFNKGTTRNTLEKAANNIGALLIFPAGKDNHWNDGRQVNLKNRKKYDDVKFISKLIDHVIEKYDVDADRVFVTGMSNGGFMAIRLAIELSDKIKAVAAVSAQMGFQNKFLKMRHPISFMLINGTKDPVVPYNGGEMKLFKFSKSRGNVLSTDETLEYFLKNNNCIKRSVNSSQDNHKLDMTSLVINHYKNCDRDVEVKLIKVVGGGHAWPGGKQYLPRSIIGNLSREINASKTIVDFFMNSTN